MFQESTDPLHADLTSIKRAGEQASELTRKLLTMSRQQVIEPRIVDLNQLLEDAGSRLGRLIGEDVELSFHEGDAVPRVLADPGQLEQVLMNLVVYARDAMPDGGKLTIETSAVEISDAYSRSHLGVQPGHYAMLCVSAAVRTRRILASSA